MAIIGLGTDIVEIARIETLVPYRKDRLSRRILSNKEWNIWKTHQRPIRFLAKRFAAKEAAVKAFGIGIRQGLSFNQFEVLNNKMGKPYLHLYGNALMLAEQLGAVNFHVSLTDEHHYALAIVIIEN